MVGQYNTGNEVISDSMNKLQNHHCPKPSDADLLRNITTLLLDSENKQQLLKRTGRILTDVLHSHRWSIMMKTAADQISICHAKGIPENIVTKTIVRSGEGIAGRIFQRGKGGLFLDVTHDLGMSSGGRYQSPSAICIPINFQGEVLGIININEKIINSQPSEFNSDDLGLANVLANQIALMMQVVLPSTTLSETNAPEMIAQAFEPIDPLQTQASAFDLLSRVIDMMTGNTSLDQVLSSAIEGASKLLGATRVSLMLLESEKNELHIRAAVGIPEKIADQVRVALGSGIAGRVAQTGVPQLLKNPRAARVKFSNRSDPDERDYRVNSALSVPLKIQGEILGVMNINDPLDGQVFTENDLNIATIIAGQAAVAISTTRLLEESVAAAEIRRAMTVATDIQNHLLPSLFKEEGVDIAGHSDTCEEAGGDYIDYFLTETAIEKGTRPVYICCGDVSGHGIGAALIMAMGRAFLRALVQQNSQLETVMYQMNNLIESDTPPEQFMTLFLTAIDPQHHQLLYCSAGHEPGFIYRPQTDEFKMLSATGLPLGMFDEQIYTVSTHHIQKDDLLILSTDGLSEAENPQGEQYGRSRLQQVVRKSATLKPNEIIDSVKQSLFTFTHPKPILDDLSLIIARISS